jgi:hypothetical protein
MIESIKSRDTITLDYVYTRLENDYLEKESFYEQAAIKERAFKIHSAPRQKSASGARKLMGKGYLCDQTGHRVAECPKKEFLNKDASTYLSFNPWYIDSCICRLIVLSSPTIKHHLDLHLRLLMKIHCKSFVKVISGYLDVRQAYAYLLFFMSLAWMETCSETKFRRHRCCIF